MLSEQGTPFSAAPDELPSIQLRQPTGTWPSLFSDGEESDLDGHDGADEWEDVEEEGGLFTGDEEDEEDREGPATSGAELDAGQGAAPSPAAAPGSPPEASQEYEPMDLDGDESAPSASQAEAGGTRSRGKLSRSQVVLEALHVLQKHRLSFFDFMDALFWGDEDCFAHRTCYNTRARFLQNQKLPALLRRWMRPPRSKRSNKSRPQGGFETLQEFAFQCVRETLEEELEAVDPLVRAEPGAKWQKRDLQSLDLAALELRVQEVAPNLWKLFSELAVTEDQKRRNTHKNSNKVSITASWTCGFPWNWH